MLEEKWEGGAKLLLLVADSLHIGLGVIQKLLQETHRCSTTFRTNMGWETPFSAEGVILLQHWL